MTDWRWQDSAACADLDPEIFSPVSETVIHPDAKAACGSCPVRGECLGHAVERREWGTWAGTTDKEREAIRRRAWPSREGSAA